MNIEFTDRERELAGLRALYAQPGSQLFVLYGRRRLGKTALLKQFGQGQPAVYYMADRTAAQSQRDAMARTMAAFLEEPSLAAARYDDWYALFAAFDRLRKSASKLVLVLDEFQYLCQVDRSFSSVVQKWWDEHWQAGNIFLVLCGSVTSLMHRETLAVSSPLYGRAHGQLLLQPLPAPCLRAFSSRQGQTALVQRYALCGGVPRYLELLAPYADFDTALRAGILNPLAPLHREARNLLQDEVNVPSTCWSMLAAISGGAQRISEIAGRLELPANQLTRYLELLRDLCMVTREVPVTESNPAKSKKGIYRVVDPFLRLWFGCIHPYASLFEYGDYELGLERIQPLLERHVAHCFEDLARQYIRARPRQFPCVRVGRQWGRHYELDVAAVDAQGRLAVAGEAKWSGQPIGLSILRNLEQTLSEHHLPIAPTAQLALFSKSGFSPDLRAVAKQRPELHLVANVFDEHEH